MYGVAHRWAVLTYWRNGNVRLAHVRAYAHVRACARETGGPAKTAHIARKDAPAWFHRAIGELEAVDVLAALSRLRALPVLRARQAPCLELVQ